MGPEHIHWPEPVEDPAGEIVGHVCPDCHDPCPPALLGRIDGEPVVLHLVDPGEDSWEATAWARFRDGRQVRITDLPV